MKTLRIVRPKGMEAITSLSLPTIYRLVKQGTFPRPIRLSTQAVGWDINDIAEWIDGCKARQNRGGAL